MQSATRLNVRSEAKSLEVNRPKPVQVIPGPDRLTVAKFFNPKTYVASIVVLGFLALVAAVPQWTPQDPRRLIVFLLVAAIGSSMKVSLPGVQGTMSVFFLFVLVAIAELSLPDVLLIGIVSVFVQCFWHTKSRPKPIQIPFNLSATCVTITITYVPYHSPTPQPLRIRPVLMIAAAACTQFIAPAFPLPCIIPRAEA